MKTKVFIAIAARIIILFTVTIFATFIPEYLSDFFDDKTVEYDFFGEKRTRLEWGYRHGWFVAGMILLFILSLINLVVGIVQVIRKNYDTSKWK